MCPYIRQKGKEKKKKRKKESKRRSWAGSSWSGKGKRVERKRKKGGNPYRERAYDDFVPKQISINPKL